MDNHSDSVISHPGVSRSLLHTRSVSCLGYRRSDGQWDIEGRMTDVKSFDMRNPDRGGQIAAGEPLHDISLVLTIDRSMQINAVVARIDYSPFNPCNRITDSFQKLVGLRIYPGFSRQVKELFAGTRGCTHLLELLPPISTTAYQTVWQSENGYEGDNPEIHGFLLNSCHALAADGEVVRTHWPEYSESQKQLD
ncbi:DUF2889 domain-containing protein [Motiliproteus sp. MSK22-1]|uniref:DUF2889 domain-containing protein n=1 Tax=Motiliproteus sp. MSK22-1 TaxID=1897630 RepID=UPI000977EA83|nr:DUF2889 domain-containing protein [Motiliproteus sp. MSK22-1]OMH28356.1 hypothetical protein BGP75_20845 [Motiliproteus sp. MSK22-1]